MKIEMAEQMMASYLKNIEKCGVVQCNWTPSLVQMSSLTKSDLDRVQEIVDIFRTAIPVVDIFKKSKIGQFVLQTEIDVVGFRDDGSDKHVYLVDTAFHEGGLGYKDPVGSVIKKLVRASIVSDLFFKGYKIHVWFYSPKVMPKVKKSIIDWEKIALDILNRYISDIDIALHFDDDAASLVGDLVKYARIIKDDNDLFIRAVKLLSLSGLLEIEPKGRDRLSKKRGSAISHSDEKSNLAAELKETNDNKSEVFALIDELIAGGKITSEVEALLADSMFTRNTFGISSYPLLMKADAVVGALARRYYTQHININGNVYRVVSQWKPKNLAKLHDWAKTL